eukprot:CAMPEP_0174911588 /NCGR_PEP_ID=MMETSP0167-20121228/77322_1 /TAXON_ID=38298 /ORGANISM="Rhodella maculata, Strain CCMP736" /LENGTH=80 /DNA_ID=CAMNT_0016156121 /DNA_START=1 /DNA_END=239 /DNA_ORIENTATION=+
MVRVYRIAGNAGGEDLGAPILSYPHHDATGAALAPDAGAVISCGLDSNFRAYSLETLAPLFPPRPSDYAVRLAFSPDPSS